ncbi:MAG: DUF1553 domain-containing protein, partial [Planctomycetaceae bacterium]|nr:DUF1553 domain-containing protein [Planctomycetaceae bacterium]
LEQEPTDADRLAAIDREKWVNVIARTSQKVSALKTALTSRKAQAELHFNQTSKEITQLDAQFWSLRPLRSVVPPAVVDDHWSSNPIDKFILSKLRQVGLEPNAAASRRVLARRLWFDLIGLPPTPEDIDSFIGDGSPDSYRQLVDQLLANPSFGERWGRVWLDLARYADSNGYEEDELRPHAYTYRDFVIWAMNNDLPYDDFIRWQVAGDELEPQIPLAVAATGLMTAGPYNTFIPQESERYDELDDMVSTLLSTSLGLTVGCARCHDHFYDPIPTRDYYGLVAVFKEASRHQSYLVEDEGQEYRRWADPVNRRREEIKRILKERIKEDNISDLDYFTDEEKDLLRQPIDPDNQEQARLISLCKRCLLIEDYHLNDELEPLPRDRKRYDELVAEIEALKPTLPEKPPVGLTLKGSSVAKVHVLHRGSLKRKGEEVGPGFLTVASRGRPVWDDDAWKQWAPHDSQTSPPTPRAALAYWLTDTKDGPGVLLARVLVNRLWQHHFGVGLVRTPSDFGAQGESPSHPDLLEWLATELIESGWSLKHIHRSIVTSSTYRQGASTNRLKMASDSDNRLLSRRRPQRLTAEMLWDSMLAAGGNANRTMYGPGVMFPIPEDVVFHTQEDVEDTWPTDVDSERPALRRRALYLLQKRTIPIPTMQLFDAPSAGFSCDRRKLTTVPTQMLALWHAPFVRRQAQRLARRVWDRTANVTDEEERRHAIIHQVFLRTIQRLPSADETRMSLAFLNDSRREDCETPQIAPLAGLCQVMFMSNEFIHVD